MRMQLIYTVCHGFMAKIKCEQWWRCYDDDDDDDYDDDDNDLVIWTTTAAAEIILPEIYTRFLRCCFDD